MKFYVLFLILVSPLLGLTQFEHSYYPLAPNEEIPKEFIENPLIEEKLLMAKNTLLTNEEAQTFYSKSIFLKYQLFQSGQIYLPNKLNNYIDSLKNVLLKSQPELNSKIRLYITRFTEPNAFCLPDGSIFINIGLLDKINNDSELAFILAHEIGHYAEKHSIKDFHRLSQIESQESFKNNDRSAFRSLIFSRDSEFDADSWAIFLLQQTGFDPNLAINALEVLKEGKSYSNSEYKSQIENDFFKIDTSLINSPNLKQYERNSDKVKNIKIATGEIEDIFRSHPDIGKRIEALKEIILSMDESNVVLSANGDALRSTKTTAEFEIVENQLRNQDYLNAFLKASSLASEYPHNIYLIEAMSKSLYWISHYKEINDLSFFEGSSIEDSVYIEFYALVNEMSLRDAKKMVYAFNKSNLEKTDNPLESILFYYAISTENYLGKNAAKQHYQTYIQKFPEGNYINLVKNKIE